MIGEGDKLFAHVLSRSGQSAAKRSCCSSTTARWEHRAYWGANKIDWGADNSPSRLADGPAARGRPLGAAGSRRRGGRVCRRATRSSGMAFTQFGGHVFWDKLGIVTRTPQGVALVRPPGDLGAGRTSRGRNRTLPQTVQEAIKIEAGQAQRRTARKRSAITSCVTSTPRRARVFDPLNAAARRDRPRPRPSWNQRCRPRW